MIYNGVPWYDEDGNVVNAHGVCLLEENGRYYMFGEYKTDEVNTYIGFSCYSSENLGDWRFEGIALGPQESGILGPKRVGERPKVLKCPKTGKYVMLMHADDMTYTDPHIGLAVADRIQGPYTMVGFLPYHGEPIRRWDMGTFQEEDGTAYLLLHGGDIYRLSDDYMSAEELVAHDVARNPHGESPAMFRSGDMYYLLVSNLTSWDSNDNFYFTAPSPAGPWTSRGLFAPEGSATFNSQCSFVFPLHTQDGRTVPMYMGDRWSFPHQASAATQVWLPLRADGERLSLDEYWSVWDPRTVEEHDLRELGACRQLHMHSNITGATVSVPFEGTQIMVYGHSGKDYSYARVSLADETGKTLLDHWLSFYAVVDGEGLRYASPRLPRGGYTLRLEVTGEAVAWTDKSKTRYGCRDTAVDVTAICVLG